MNLSDFDYHLPKERIAQKGLEQRDQARLMVMDASGKLGHQTIRDLPGYFRKGDLLILNDTKVSPARLLGRKDTGGKIDCMVLPDPNGGGPLREALLRGSGVRAGTKLLFTAKANGKAGSTLNAEVLEKLEGAKYRVRFDAPELIDACGEMPLPPYIKEKLADPERYQTVYAKNRGSLAAPTAGLHFTPGLFKALDDIGVERAHLTLHVGIGTFAPIRVEKLEDWRMHSEYCEVTPDAAQRISAAMKSGRRCFAVGTTSVRTLETMTEGGKIKSGSASADLFIYPGYQFKFPYAGLLTNFHLPKSTLLLLVSALAGREKILAAYEEAIKKEYRFFSFGDAMLILK